MLTTRNFNPRLRSLVSSKTTASKRGAAISPTFAIHSRKGNRLSAQVRGSYLYEVEIEVGANSIDSVCTCSWGGNCKHVGAVLLACGCKRPTPLRSSNKILCRYSRAKMGIFLMSVQDEPAVTTEPKHCLAGCSSRLISVAKCSEKTLNSVLQTMMIDEMRAIAESCNWKIKGTRKADLAQQLTNACLIQPKSAANRTHGCRTSPRTGSDCTDGQY